MKKIFLLAILVAFLNGCAYNPIVDTAGKSGTFNTDQAKEITNDLQHCKTIADNNTDFIGNIIYWIGSVEAETEHQSIYRKCLVNRGHSVLN